MRWLASVGVAENAGLVGEGEEFAEVGDGAGGFSAADHAEVGLEAIEEGEEDDAGFVVLGGRSEDVARERHGGREQLVVARDVAGVERGESEGCGGRDGVEDAEQRVAVAGQHRRG